MRKFLVVMLILMFGCSPRSEGIPVPPTLPPTDLPTLSPIRPTLVPPTPLATPATVGQWIAQYGEPDYIVVKAGAGVVWADLYYDSLQTIVSLQKMQGGVYAIHPDTTIAGVAHKSPTAYADDLTQMSKHGFGRARWQGYGTYKSLYYAF